MITTITTLANGIKAEYIKSKGTKLLWLTLAVPVFISILAFLIFQNRPLGKADVDMNGWERLAETTLSLLAFNMLMMSVISIISLSVQTEHKANTWKHLLILPIPNWTVFVSKYLFILLLIAGVHVGVFVFYLVNGHLLTITRPALNFGTFPPAYYAFSGTLAKVFISVLAVTAIQYWFSLRSKNYMLPLFLGIFAVMVSTFAALLGWSKSVFIPYDYVTLTDMFTDGRINEAVYGGLPRFLWFSLAGFAVVSVFAVFDFTRRRIKA